VTMTVSSRPTVVSGSNACDVCAEEEMICPEAQIICSEAQIICSEEEMICAEEEMISPEAQIIWVDPRNFRAKCPIYVATVVAGAGIPCNFGAKSPSSGSISNSSSGSGSDGDDDSDGSHGQPDQRSNYVIEPRTQRCLELADVSERGRHFDTRASPSTRKRKRRRKLRREGKA